MAGFVSRKLLQTSASVISIRALRYSFPHKLTTTTSTRSLILRTCCVNPRIQLSSTVKNENRMCLKCQQKVYKTEFVCSKCNSLLTPNLKLTHFELFEMEENFDLDVPTLTNKFKNLQRRFHPDKYSQKSQEEQDYSAIYSAQINRAYQTLLKPVQRGLYILETNGKPLEEESVTMSPEFLTEIMETNEILSETKSLEKVKTIATIYTSKSDKLMIKLSQNLKKKNWDEAQKTLAKLKYYANIEEKARNILNEAETK